MVGNSLVTEIQLTRSPMSETCSRPLPSLKVKDYTSRKVGPWLFWFWARRVHLTIAWVHICCAPGWIRAAGLLVGQIWPMAWGSGSGGNSSSDPGHAEAAAAALALTQGTQQQLQPLLHALCQNQSSSHHVPDTSSSSSTMRYTVTASSQGCGVIDGQQENQLEEAQDLSVGTYQNPQNPQGRSSQWDASLPLWFMARSYFLWTMLESTAACLLCID